MVDIQTVSIVIASASVVASSCPSSPVSSNIVNIVAYFSGDALMILCMFSVIGISGILRSVSWLFPLDTICFTEPWDMRSIVLFWLRCIRLHLRDRFLLLRGF